MIVALAAVGYFLIPTFLQISSTMGSLLGAFIGLVISVVLWFLVGEKFVQATSSIMF